MTNNDDTEFTARARAFSGEGVRAHRFLLSAEGTLRIWDPVAGHFTTCHDLSAGQVARLKVRARGPWVAVEQDGDDW